MPHDPSTCPRCRWAAEREGGITTRTTYDAWTPSMVVSAPKSYCSSLDAVAGLLRELFCLGWIFGWSEERQQWVIYSEINFSQQYLSDDYSCVIDAAMRVLEGKESDA